MPKIFQPNFAAEVRDALSAAQDQAAHARFDLSLANNEFFWHATSIANAWTECFRRGDMRYLELLA